MAMFSQMERKTYLRCLFFILLLAGILRLWGLSRWSFASDELGTYNEIELFLHPKADSDGDDNIPKMIPISIGLHYLAYEILGVSEFKARLIPALFGWLQICILGLLLPILIHRGSSLGIVLCLTLSPEHIFYCQYHRFYTITGFFLTLSLLLSQIALNRSSWSLMLSSLLSGFIVIFSHTLSSPIIGLIFLFSVIHVWYSRQSQKWTSMILPSLGVICAGLIFLFYLYPLGKSKAIDYHWKGLLPFDALASSISQLSWPIALASIMGVFFLWKSSRVMTLQWVAVCLTWLAMVLVFPRIFSFHSAYVFPMNIGYFVFAGIATTAFASQLVDSLAHRYQLIIFLLGLTFIPLLNLPALVSYYQNGNRHDFRSAAQWLVEHTCEDDFLAVLEGDKLEYYQPSLKGRWKRLPRKDYEKWFEENRSFKGKNWFVIPGGRYGIPSEWKAWIEKNGSIETTIVARRFDDHDYPILIILYRDPT